MTPADMQELAQLFAPLESINYFRLGEIIDKMPASELEELLVDWWNFTKDLRTALGKERP